jgi:hypothetical protein
VQRAAIPARHDLAFRRFGLLARLFWRRQQNGVELRVERLDARQQRVGQLDRRQPARLDQRAASAIVSQCSSVGVAVGSLGMVAFP